MQAVAQNKCKRSADEKNIDVYKRQKAYEQGENKISKKLLMFLREGKELITYEN